MNTMNTIKDKLEQVELQISSACKQANRSPNDVTLLAVSKKKSESLIKNAYHAGQRNFGESYVQEAVEKVKNLQTFNDISWHFIGPIQTNKTNLIAKHFSWVHSIDRIKVAKRLNDQISQQDTRLNVCLQVNISQEVNKSGVSVEELDELATFVSQQPHLLLRGLMAIPEKNAPLSSFKQMQQLFLQYKAQYPTIDTLSMGMSSDLDTAINFGSTMVRVGTAIFGDR